MSDEIDRATAQTELWLAGQISKVSAVTHTMTLAQDCCDCGEAIGQARKQAVPWAVRCVVCQAAYEHR